MATLGKPIKMGVAAVLMLAGVTVGAQGRVTEGGFSFGTEGVGVMQIRGNVICAECSLAEARQARPGRHDLYQLIGKQGRVVMRVSWVSNSERWIHVVWPPRLWVRGEDGLLQQLNAEENLFKELEITGLLSNSRTLDVVKVTISG
jgi:hypothetical protein